MPELHDDPFWEQDDYDGPADGSIEHPGHDALHGNPQLREYFAEAREDGMDYDEALEWAREQVEAESFEVDEEDLEKAREEYERVDDALFRAYENSVWWGLGAEDNGIPLALEKAPGIWTDGEQVPDFVQDLIEEVIEQTDWDWDQFESLSNTEVQRLEEVLQEVMTQPDGWTIGELAEEIGDEFDLDQGPALGIARDTAHSTLNTTREEAYEQMEGSEQFEYSWIGPDDDDTTPTCEEIKAEIEDRGGAVPMDELKDILREKAEKYENTREGGGTPGRVDVFEAHFQCRHTFVREVQ